MPSLLSEEPRPDAYHDPRSRNVIRQLFDKQNGFSTKTNEYLDFLLEDFECLLEDALTIEGG